MIIPSIFLMIFGLFIMLIGYRFLFRTTQTIKRLQEMKFNASSEPEKKAINMTRIFGVVLLLIGLYFIGLGVTLLIN